MERDIDAEAQARIWRYYQNADPQSFLWARPRLRFLAGQVDRLCGRSAARVLTVGAGDGYLEARLGEQGHAVTCFDLDRQSVDRLQQQGIDARQVDLTRFSWQQAPFDLVLLSEVLEHIRETDAPRALANLLGVLRPGGHLLLTVPCREDLSKSLFCCPHCGEVSHRYGHLQSFDRDKIAALLAGAGLHVVELREGYYPHYRGLNMAGKLVFAAKHLAWRLFRRHTPGVKYYVHAVK